VPSLLCLEYGNCKASSIKGNEETRKSTGIEVHRLICSESAFSNFLPRFEGFVFSVGFVQGNTSYLKGQPSECVINDISPLLSLLLLLVAQICVEKTQVRHVSCRNRNRIVNVSNKQVSFSYGRVKGKLRVELA